MSQTPHVSSGEKSLSNFWRECSDDRVLELVSTLRGADSLIGLMGSNLQVTWSGNGLSYTDLVGKKVALDYGPLQGKPCPFLGSAVDEVIGYAAHEGGHCLFTEHVDEATVGKQVERTIMGKSTAWRRAWRVQRDQIIQDIYRIANILEDAHVDFWVGKKWPVLGEYIRVARGRMKERTPVDLDAIAAQPRPDRDGVVTLWVNASLYTGFPKGPPATWDDAWWRERCPTRMRAAVERAMEYLMGLTRKAVGDRPGQRDYWDRFLLALEAVKYLYQFPVPEAPPTSQAGGSTSSPPTQGAGAGQPQQGGGQGQGTSPSQPQQGQSQEQGKGQAEGGEDGMEDEAEAKGDAGDQGDEGEEGEADQGQGEAEGEGEQGGQQGGQGAGKVGNPSASSGQALDDFGPRHRGHVVEIPKALLDQVLEAIVHEVEDLTQSVAEVLAADPRHVAAQARKADDDPELARQVTAQVMPQVREIRRMFDRQRDAQSVHLKGLPRGRLDDRRLARVGAGNLNAFHRKEVLAQPDLALGLLLDVSGSMSGHMEIVNQTAAVFAEGLVRKPGVNFAAWCYTGGSAHVDLTRICDRQMGKLHLGNVSQGGGTPSGAAIAGVVVLMRRMPERKKVLIHFTDGWPDSGHHVTRAVQAARTAGIRVYTIGVGRAGATLQAQYGTGNWETVSQVPELPQAVGRLVKDLDRLQR